MEMPKAMLLLALMLPVHQVVADKVMLTTQANPMRKIINMLQDMGKELEREEDQEAELFEKAMCACEGGEKEVTKAITDSLAQIDAAKSKIGSGTAEKFQVAQDLEEHKTNLETTKQDLSTATELREKEKAKYARAEPESKLSVKQLDEAIAALEGGSSSGAGSASSGGGGGECECLPESSRPLLAFEGDMDGQNCIISTALDGTKHCYPINYGTGTCAAWDKDLPPECASIDGVPLSDAPSWCDQQWCYVDPAKCPQSKISGLFDTDPPTYYSHETCGFTSKAYEDEVQAKNIQPAEPGASGCSCLAEGSNPLKAFTGSMDGKDCIISTALDGTKHCYPTDYGTGRCAAWDKHLPPECAGPDGEPLPDAPEWCKQQWCYVDPVECPQSLPSGLFDTNPPTHFSHAVCGTDSGAYEAEIQSKNIKPAEPEDAGVHEGCGCLAEGAHPLKAFQGTMDGKDCIIATAYDGKKHCYPTNYGAGTCAAWDHDLPPECADSDGTPLPNAPDWCSEQWCYVDPEKCPAAEKSLLFDTEAYFSHTACGTHDNKYEEDMKEQHIQPAEPGAGSDGCACLAEGSHPLQAFEGSLDGKDCVIYEGQDGSKHCYPSNYGTGSCAAWDQDLPPECAGPDAPGWCSEKWCYVDPAKCPDAEASAYFVTSPPTYYSHSVCGVSGSKFEKVEGGIQPAKPGGKVQSCPCLDEGSRPLMEFEGSLDGQDCIILEAGNGMDGKDGKKYCLPTNYGTGKCNTWDQNMPPSCNGANPPKWCSEKWCYIDMAKCVGIDDAAESAYFQTEPPTYFSHAACGENNEEYLGDAKVHHENSLMQMLSLLQVQSKASGTQLMQMLSPKVTSRLRKVIDITTYISNDDRQKALAFLDLGSGENLGESIQAPSSGEITGILKQMRSEMSKDLGEMQSDEQANVQTFVQMEKEKKQEIAVIEAAIISKGKRLGELDVLLAETNHDLEDAQEKLADAQNFKATMKEECAQKKKDRNLRIKMRKEEIVAISEAVSILNDDDALDTFKKTSSLSSALLQQRQKKTYDAFIQLQSTHRVVRSFVSLRSASRTTGDGCECLTQSPLISFQGALDGKDCVISTALDGVKHCYPTDYGTGTCKLWDKALPPSCASSDGAPLPNAPEWCNQQWCYVDAAKCPDAKESALFVTDPPTYYSHSVCGSDGSEYKEFVKEEHVKPAEPEADSVDPKQMIKNIIGGMSRSIHNEDVDDEIKQRWCEKEVTINEALKASQSEELSRLTAEIEEIEDNVAGLTENIKVLGDSISSTDKQVFEFTEQRKKEHQEFVDAFSTMGTAKRLVEKAIVRLEKFYSPKAHAAKQEAAMKKAGLSLLGKKANQHTLAIQHMEEKLAPDFDSFAQVQAVTRRVASTYVKQESGGVIGLMNQFKTDLMVDMTEAETDEKHAASDYTRIMADAKESRTTDVKSLNQKKRSKAHLDEEFVASKSRIAILDEKLRNVELYLVQVHADCNFLLENFESRHQNRIAQEINLHSALTMVTENDPPSLSKVKQSFDEEKTPEDVAAREYPLE